MPQAVIASRSLCWGPQWESPLALHVCIYVTCDCC